ncbi:MULTISPECIES: hypothetical protein [Pseudomonas]|uniref:hypothetical protein n=1 Tax=Pseudomonas TaxID=286 RepID=UPI00301C3A33
MNDRYPLCTRTNPWGRHPEGLLDNGEQPWPETVAARAFPSLIEVEGEYDTDDYSAALFLANELALPDNGLSEQERLEALALLLQLFVTLERTGQASAQALEALRERAEAIPKIGPHWFSPTSLPSTLGTVANLIYASAKSKRLIDLLALPEPLKKDLKAWAATRGRSGSRSARKTFQRRIKLVNVGGNLKFQIPAMQAAAYYNFGPLQVGNHLHVPAYGSQRMLNSRLGLDPKMYGKQGFGKIVGGNAVGAALAFGPQAVADARASGSIGEFFERSAYSQSGNAVAFGVGLVVTIALAAASTPVVLVIIASYLSGTAAQYFFNEFNLDKSLGNRLTGRNL